MKLGGLLLFVKDVENLKNFYQQHFKLEIVEEIPFSWVLLKSGNIELGLHKTGSEYIYSTTNSGENNNVKLIFETEENIFELVDQLKNLKVKVDQVRTWDNYDFWVCDGSDPEGNVFQIKQKKS